MSDPFVITLPDGCRVSCEPVDEWIVVRPHPLGGQGQRDVADELWRQIRLRGAEDVILEMNDVTFLSSAMMGEIIRLHKRIAMAKGRFRVCGLQEHPHEAFHTMRLDQIVPTFETREEALQYHASMNE